MLQKICQASLRLVNFCVNSDGRKKRYKMVAHKRSKRKHPEGKLMMYVFMLTILLCLLYFSAKLMILKLAKSMEEQKVEAYIENEDTNVDDIGGGMCSERFQRH
uniref:Transmembrane protein n=1 Tax=Opuntia streptacantha TaxID=393608 RepID=A0A7C9EBP4_OPUST